MTGPALIADSSRRAVATVIVLSAIVVAWLAAVVWHGSTTAIDVWTFHALDAHLDGRIGMAMLGTTSPEIPVFLLALVVVVAGAVRRWDVVLLAALGPSVALVLTEWVLKPLVGRRLGSRALAGVVSAGAPTAFPSGHETGVASTALVLLLVLRLLPLGRGARAVSVLVPAGWTVIAGLGLVRRHWHYLTDVIAAVGVSAVVVLGLALILDTVGWRLSSPDAHSRPRTAHAV